MSKLASSTQTRGTKETFQLVKFEPDFIFENWDELKDIVRDSLTHVVNPVTDSILNNVLASIMSGRLVCIGGYNSNDELILLSTVCPVVDILEIKKLLIFSLYIFDYANIAVMYKFIDSVKDYARKLGCTKITTMTESKKVRDLFSILGGKTDTYILSLEI